MRNRLTCCARLLKERFTENGCMFISQKNISGMLVLDFHRNNLDNKIIEHIIMNCICKYRLEISKDDIKILLYEE